MYKSIYILVFLINITTAVVYSENEVYLDFFYVPGCLRCDEITEHVDNITYKYNPYVITNHYNLSNISNYNLLSVLETKTGSTENEPLVIFIGSNCLHGAESIINKLDQLVAESIAKGGVKQWRPVNTDNHKNAIRKRFSTFSWLIIIGAGLVDGINPCAFATLLLFSSMLACYQKSKRDIFLTALLFASGVGFTYMLLGMFFFSSFRFAFNIEALRIVLHITLAGVCICMAILSIRDAIHYKKTSRQNEIWMKLPSSIQNIIHYILHSYTGKNIFFIGVIFAGIVVSLLESVCTGQLYVPTLAFMSRQADTRFTAILMLFIYNCMFILPLFILAVMVSLGIKGIMLAQVSRKHIIPALIIQSILFLIVGIVIILII